VQIHSTAIVHPKATLADDVEIGPFCLIGEHVTIGKGTRLLSHVTVDGWTEIGERNEVYSFVSIGGPPQHLGYKGEATKVIIGHDNIIREYVTVNRATAPGGGVTTKSGGDGPAVAAVVAVYPAARQARAPSVATSPTRDRAGNVAAMADISSSSMLWTRIRDVAPPTAAVPTSAGVARSPAAWGPSVIRWGNRTARSPVFAGTVATTTRPSAAP